MHKNAIASEEEEGRITCGVSNDMFDACEYYRKETGDDGTCVCGSHGKIFMDRYRVTVGISDDDGSRDTLREIANMVGLLMTSDMDASDRSKAMVSIREYVSMVVSSCTNKRMENSLFRFPFFLSFPLRPISFSFHLRPVSFPSLFASFPFLPPWPHFPGTSTVYDLLQSAPPMHLVFRHPPPCSIPILPCAPHPLPIAVHRIIIIISFCFAIPTCGCSSFS